MTAADEGGKESLFPPTEWTSVLKPISENSRGSDAALERLCLAYQRPIYGYLRWRGYDHHAAEEIVQEFIVALIRQEAFTGLSRENGRFRSFLLACLRNFLSKRRRAEQTQKRGGGVAPVPLDDSMDDVGEDPESVVLEFDRRWAIQLLDAALQQVRREYNKSGRRPRFEDLMVFLTSEGEKVPRKDLAEQLGVRPGYLDVLVHRIRQSYGTAVRDQVAQTLQPADSEEAIRGELHYLMRILTSSQGSTLINPPADFL